MNLMDTSIFKVAVTIIFCAIISYLILECKQKRKMIKWLDDEKKRHEKEEDDK